MAWIQDIIEAIVSTFVGVTSGMAEGVTVLFQDLLTTATGDLTVFGTFAFVVLGLGLATGIFSSLVALVRNRG
jgi:hypothetical protein